MFTNRGLGKLIYSYNGIYSASKKKKRGALTYIVIE